MASSSTTTTSTSLSALIPSGPETLLLLTYPATLLLGSLFSLLNPTTRSAPYSASLQSHPPAEAPAYFAKKSNILNVYFVKIAWFWITLAFFTFTFTAEKPRGILTTKRLKAILRWILATTWWVLVTQWCFGPALIDRGFRFTGGICELAAGTMDDDGFVAKGDLLATSRACKSIGGAWKGGHDISGHVFILVLGSAFLILEMLPVWLGWKADAAKAQEDEEEEGVFRYGKWPLLVVVGLSWWMLFMTAIYFHTWFEKFTGLVTALLQIFVIYFLPRILPGLRDVIGAPGV